MKAPPKISNALRALQSTAYTSKSKPQSGDIHAEGTHAHAHAHAHTEAHTHAHVQHSTSKHSVHASTSKKKRSLVPSSMTFQAKKYHGCLICISGVLSERYTDPSRKLARFSSDWLAFVKFRSNQERDFVVHALLLLHHLEESKVLGSDGRQRVLYQLMHVLGMSEIDAKSTLAARPTTTDAAVDKLGLARVVLELAMALPTTYWAGLSQHQHCLTQGMLDVAGHKAHALWGELLDFVEQELAEAEPEVDVIGVGRRLEARFAGRSAYFPATVLRVHPGGKAFDLKYDSSYARAHARRSRQKSLTTTQAEEGEKEEAFVSQLLDDGETELGVPLALVRTFPEPPRTPREAGLKRVALHLRALLRLSVERPVLLLHHREHFLPPLVPPPPAEIPSGMTSVLWMKEEIAPIRGLYDVNRNDGLLFRGKYGVPDVDDDPWPTDPSRYLPRAETRGIFN